VTNLSLLPSALESGPLTFAPVTTVDDNLPDRLERFLEPFRGDFRRREQARWAAVYLQGLLRPGARKNIETLARSVQLPADLVVEDVAQALQHFIHQSPWDEERLWRRYWARLATQGLPQGSTLILEELGFVKQGRHSVGVQRQFSRALGRKVNCQAAIALHLLSPGRFVPLGLRLYLPRGWLQDAKRLDTAGVPEPARRPVSKSALGLALVDAALGAGLAPPLLAGGTGWPESEEMESSLAQRGLAWQPAVNPEFQPLLAAGRRQLLEELGLEHFEGRSWRGFHHHACLVMLAHGFLAGL
jgi:SRSO17 transposase